MQESGVIYETDGGGCSFHKIFRVSFSSRLNLCAIDCFIPVKKM